MRRVKSPVRYKSQVTVLWTQTKPRETETEKQEVMGRGLVSLLLICLKRYGKVLVFQPLIAGAHKGMYKSVGRLTLCQLPQLAGLIQDWWSLPPSLFFPFPFPQSCQVVLGLPWSPIKPHSLDRYICITVRVPTLTENLFSPFLVQLMFMHGSWVLPHLSSHQWDLWIWVTPPLPTGGMWQSYQYSSEVF